jgi:hypothetical protein
VPRNDYIRHVKYENNDLTLPMARCDSPPPKKNIITVPMVMVVLLLLLLEGVNNVKV